MVRVSILVQVAIVTWVAVMHRMTILVGVAGMAGVAIVVMGAVEGIVVGLGTVRMMRRVMRVV